VGSLERTAFEATIMDLLPLLGGGITFEDIQPILENLYDVQVGGSCSALSVGLTGSATLLQRPELARHEVVDDNQIVRHPTVRLGA
jgi:hypothetical protein